MELCDLRIWIDRTLDLWLIQGYNKWDESNKAERILKGNFMIIIATRLFFVLIGIESLISMFCLVGWWNIEAI